ncbi:MAG: hypothetical protein H7330_06260 [Hymenobacteraceae bacterium]|nr:hypothetical protein [Hymenobacteraceae bacterium]
MDLYAYLLLPTGIPNTPAARQAETDAMTAHFQHLQGLRDGCVLNLPAVGGQADFGLVVFKTESLDRARDTMYNDPLITEGLMTGMCVPFQFVLRGEMMAVEEAATEG